MDATSCTLEQFQHVKKLIVETLDDNVKDEWYATHRAIAANLLTIAEHNLFGGELARNERYAQYLKLKAEFEGNAP